ncbi:PX domain-containing protein, partial [Haematococcus lacustris]
MVSGRSDDAMEDAEYIRVRDYINNLEGHLVEAHRQAGRLVRKEVQLSSALAEFGIAAEHLGKLDDGLVRGTFDVLCARSGQIATASKSRADAMAVSFEAPLKESARTIKGVQTAMADRAAALSTFAQAKSELDGRKVRLAKLRGTPGLKEEKISDAERDVAEGEARQHEARIAYDTIVARMTEELNRFQKERAAEMSQLL